MKVQEADDLLLLLDRLKVQEADDLLIIVVRTVRTLKVQEADDLLSRESLSLVS